MKLIVTAIIGGYGAMPRPDLSAELIKPLDTIRMIGETIMQTRNLVRKAGHDPNEAYYLVQFEK